MCSKDSFGGEEAGNAKPIDQTGDFVCMQGAGVLDAWDICMFQGNPSTLIRSRGRLS